MNTLTRLAAFGLGLVAVFAVAIGVGRLADPVAVQPAAGPDAGHAASDVPTRPRPRRRSPRRPAAKMAARATVTRRNGS